MVRMDFTSLFYSESHNRETLMTGLDSLLRTEQHMLTIMPYASEKSPNECFRAYALNRSFKHISSQDGVNLFNLVFHSPREETTMPGIEGKFFIYEHPKLSNTYVLLTIESQDFVRRALIPFIERSYPRIYLTLISQQHMHSLLREFKDNRGFTELKVVRAVHRSRFPGQRPRQETMISSVIWSDLGLDGAFDYVHELNGWFKSLTFQALRNSRVYAEITVSRNGIMKTDGEFLRVFDNLVSPICNMVHDNHELFKNRSRRDSVSLEVRPLTIKFHRDQLADEEERAKLVEAMRLLDNASMSVVHSNPYLQLSVIDYFDGSTFDLWVLNPKELIIVPQLKGTVSSIRRLISHVFDNYAEGYIEDFQAVG